MNPDELKYLEERIRSLITDVHTAWGFFRQEDDGTYEQADWQFQLNQKTQALYYCMLTYFEARGFVHKLNELSKYGEEIRDEEKTVKEIEFFEPYGSTPYYLDRFQDLLMGLKEFGSSVKNRPANILINILQQTAHILSEKNVLVKREEDIYKAVLWFIRVCYPTTRKKDAKSRFISQFKNYQADILIPELRTAIEYKYIRKKTDAIDNCMDQLIADAHAYKGDSDYTIFIAVLCLESKTVPQESILNSWNERKFPENWSIVIQFLS